MQRIEDFTEPHLQSSTENAVAARDQHARGDTLLAFSRGQLSQADAIRDLGLRDYAGLLVALGDANLPMPLPPEQEIEAQAATFAEFWRRT